MPRLYLIRHARPTANWTEALDAGLDATGEQQAQAVAQTLVQELTSMPIFTSPLRRCRETARPLELLWNQTAQVLHPVSEIPLPESDPLDKKGWLRQAMGGTWQEVHDSSPPDSPDYLAWRLNLLTSLLRIAQDSVIFSHYIAINAVVGAAQCREKIVCFRPDHVSVTSVDVIDDQLSIVAIGREIDTSLVANS